MLNNLVEIKKASLYILILLFLFFVLFFVYCFLLKIMLLYEWKGIFLFFQKSGRQKIAEGGTHL